MNPNLRADIEQAYKDYQWSDNGLVVGDAKNLLINGTQLLLVEVDHLAAEVARHKRLLAEVLAAMRGAEAITTDDIIGEAISKTIEASIGLIEGWAFKLDITLNQPVQASQPDSEGQSDI